MGCSIVNSQGYPVSTTLPSQDNYSRLQQAINLATNGSNHTRFVDYASASTIKNAISLSSRKAFKALWQSWMVTSKKNPTYC